MKDIETLRQYAIEDLEHLRDGLADRRQIDFENLHSRLIKLTEENFFSDGSIHSDIFDFSCCKKELCQFEHWRKWFLFWECMRLRISMKHPEFAFREQRTHRRWIEREVRRTKTEAIRSAVQKFIRTEFIVAPGTLRPWWQNGTGSGQYLERNRERPGP